MNPQYYFLNSAEISTKVYFYCTNWHTKLNFALLNSRTLKIAFSERNDLVYNFKSATEIKWVYHLPLTTATTINLTNANNIDTAFYVAIFSKNVFCTQIEISTEQSFGIDAITKFCKLFAKKNVTLIYKGPQLKLVTEILTKYAAQYLEQFTLYAKHGSLNPPKKRKVETMLMTVPTDPAERLNFFLAEASKLAKYGTIATTISDITISPCIKNVLNYSNRYEILNEEIVGIDINTPFMMLKKEVLDKRISEIAQVFVDSVIKFENIEIYITSGDIFLHNHFSIDDCAYGLGSHEVYQKPIAKIKESSYMGSKTYYDLSIYWSFVEFLMTGGFFSFGSGPVQLLLGSSLGKWKHGELTSTEIFILKDPPEKAFSTTRLLNQYHKRDAHRLWGFHSLKSFTGGLTPISPLHIVDHISQKNKEQDMYHFASKLLFIVTSPDMTTKSDLVTLFLFFSRLSFFRKYCQSRNALNFNDFQKILHESDKVPVYLSFLVGVAVNIEQLVNDSEVCYVSSMLDNAKDVSIKIVKNGLKNKIIKHTEKVTEAYRK